MGSRDWWLVTGDWWFGFGCALVPVGEVNQQRKVEGQNHSRCAMLLPLEFLQTPNLQLCVDNESRVTNHQSPITSH